MDANKAARSFQVRAVQACAWCMLLFAIPGVAQTSQKLHRHVPQVVSSGQAKQVGTVPVQQKIQMTIVLPVRNQAGLTSLLGQLYDPSSPNYRHFLSVQQFTDQFGPTAQDYDGVIQWAKNNGFTIDHELENRLILDVSGTAGQVNSALNVSMITYQDPKGSRTFFSIDREPTLNLSVPVAHIQGLNNYSIPQPMLKKAKSTGPIANVTGSGPGGSYLGSDIRAAYYGGSLLTGAGQCVGLFEFGGYRLSDVNLTFANAGQSYSVAINNATVDYGSTEAGNDDSEQVLDIVQAIEMAPGLSQVRVYIDDITNYNSTPDANIFNAMATENVCKQLSVSWSWLPDDPSTDDGIFQEFAAQGQSLFVASGDLGAYDASVSPYFYPAEDAYVTAVGGTHLTTNYGGGPWITESAWNDSGYGSGGGISPDGIPIPGWQQATAANTNGSSTSLRNGPDVAMEADLDNYYCAMGTCGGGAGGTSFAAPRWAAFMALVNQQATEAGTAPTGGVGFINPAIYSIGQGANYAAEFHDITSGNNDTDNQSIWYSAAPGYDLVTGWGSPAGQSIIDALAGPVVPGFWTAASPGVLSVAQAASTTATVSIIDAGGFSGNVNLSASGLPAGVTASFSPNSTAGTSVLTLTASASATVGPATITITGTSGSLRAVTSLFLTVNSPFTSPTPNGAFGSVNVGSTSAPSALTVAFTAAGTLGSIAVLTQGVANLDFSNASGGTCAIGTAYRISATCTVKVTFSPKYAGLRYGAIVLADSSGNQLGVLYLQGTGNAAQTTFAPGTQLAVGSGFINPEAVAMLGDGSLYITDYGSGSNGAVYFEKLSNGSYTQSTLGCAFKTPVGIAVDGGGTIYVADPGVPAVYKVVVSNGTCSETTLGSGFGKPWGVAVDGSGDLYITDIDNYSAGYSGAVFKETLQANGSYLQSTVGSGWVLPLAVAVDGSGNIDLADYGVPGVFRETPSEGSYTQTAIGTGWTAPAGIAVDGAGNIYVSDSGNNVQSGGGGIPATVVKEVLTAGKYLQLPIGSGWVLPYGIAVDASGNLYVADDLRGVYKNDLADPASLVFANTATGTNSSDSPKTVTVSNIGTGALQFSTVAYPADFPEAIGFPSDCTSSTAVPAGESCTLSIDFLPMAALGGNASLALNESVGITTNTLNTIATQQTLSVSGTEVLPTGSVVLSVSSNPTATGTPIILTASATGPAGGPTPTGTITFYNGATVIAGPVTLNSGVAMYSTTSLAPATYAILASYSGDANYQAANSNTVSESIVAAPGISGFGDTSIGTQNIGSTSGAIPLTIKFTSAETLGSIAVLTEGVPNLDFANTGGGSCSIGTAYASNSTCTVNVTFTPKYSGTRYGALVLADNGGNVIGTGYLEGAGVGPQTAFQPGALTSVTSGLGYPQGVAVDGSGNLFVADALNGAVYKEVLANGTWTQSTVGTGFSQPYAVAIDGAGDLYVADVGNRAVYKEVPSNGSYTQTVIGSGFIWPAGVAVDAVGNVYVADFGDGVNPGTAYLETPSNGTYTQSTVGTGFVTPQGIAVDGNGNIYVADSGNGNGAAGLYELKPSAGSYIQTAIGTGWATPSGVAVDGNGNVYVADDAYDLGDGSVTKEALQSDGSYVQTTVLASTSTPYPGGVAVDGRGNLYISDNLDGVLYKDDLADSPSLSFAATMFGSTSSDSPRIVAVQNIGNATLTFSAVSYPADFPEASGIQGDCTSSTSLAVGATCTQTINFTPSASNRTNQPTQLSENVTITTNSLNAGSAQSIAVSGTEAAPVATVALVVPTNITTAGNSVSFTAMVTGQTGVAPPTGSVTFYSNNTALGSVSLNNGTASYATSSLAVGTFSITASYSGDQNYPTAISNAINVQVIPATTFGIQNVGTSSSPNPISLIFPSRATLGTISVVTQGMPNLDYTDIGSGTCKVGTTYAAGASCTVTVSFSPRFSGSRYGAVVLGDNKGSLIQEKLLQGTGVGPQLSFATKTQSTIGPGGYIVVDGNGDAYVLSTNGTSSITKWSLAANGTYTSTTIPTSYAGSEIAVDGSGSIYLLGGYSTTKNNIQTSYVRVVKEAFVAPGKYQESVVLTISEGGCSWGQVFAVDANDNIFIADTCGGDLYKETSSNGSYTQSTLWAGQAGYTFPQQVAVDGIGNVYLSYYGDTTYITQVLKFIPSGGGYVQSAVASAPYPANKYFSMAVDGMGNVYFENAYGFSSQTGYSASEVQKAVPLGNGYVQSTLIPDWLLTANGEGINYLAVDGGQNLYVDVNHSNGSSPSLIKIDLADPPQLSFATTTVGSASSDSPKAVQLINVGNAALNLPAPISGTNPSISSNFSLDSKTTSCPQVSASGPAAGLNAGSSCTYGVDFVPTTSGAISGSLVLTDNALNPTGAMQSIPLTGTGNGNTSMAIISIGADGQRHVSWVARGVATSNASLVGSWLDAYTSHYIAGVAEFITGTCTEVQSGNLSEIGDIVGGHFTFGHETVELSQCPNQTYTLATVSGQWGSDQEALQDLVNLRWTDKNGELLNNLIAKPEFTPISITPATQSGPNGPLTAIASLPNPPKYATGYQWTITGGGGAVVFPGGSETMKSSTPSVTIEEPTPSGSIVPFSITALVTIPDPKPLNYGPTAECFCPPYLSSSTPLWFFGLGVNPPSTFTIGNTQSVVTALGASGGSYAWSIASGQGIVSFAPGTTLNSSTSTSNTVTIYSVGFSTSQNDVTIQLVWTPSGGSPITRTLALSVDSPYQLTLDVMTGPTAVADCNLPTPDPGNVGWWSHYRWRIFSFFGIQMPGISVNENFDNEADYQPETYWTFDANGGPGKTGVSTFTDDYCKAFNPIVSPEPTQPQNPLGQNKVDSATQFYNIGSSTVGDGVTVQTQTLTRYVDHSTLTNIVSPVRSRPE